MVAMVRTSKERFRGPKGVIAAPEAVNLGEHSASPLFIPIPRGRIRYIWTNRLFSRLHPRGPMTSRISSAGV